MVLRFKIGLFVLAATALLFWNLHRVPLFDPDDGRYVDMALETLQTGDWLVPHMNYMIYLHKPPLFNWMVAASFKLYLITSRLAITDLALTFFVFVGIFSGSYVLFGARRRLFFFYLGICALALAMLIKGPVAWMISLLPLWVFILWKKSRFRSPRLTSFSASFCCSVSP